MSVARPRSREVKLIFFIASTIGRASKLLMSICSTTLASSSCLRVSLILVWSFTSVLQYPRHAGEPGPSETLRIGRDPGSRRPRRSPSSYINAACLELNHVIPGDLTARPAVEAGHRLVVDDDLL